MQIQVSSPVSAAITKSIQEAYMSLIAIETYRVTDGMQKRVHRALTSRVLSAEVA